MSNIIQEIKNKLPYTQNWNFDNIDKETILSIYNLLQQTKNIQFA